MMFIRVEQYDDSPAVHVINEQAFGQSTEADIVDRLRKSCPDCLSLVAQIGDTHSALSADLSTFYDQPHRKSY